MSSSLVSRLTAATVRCRVAVTWLRRLRKRDVLVTAAATRMVTMWEITVQGIRRARSFVDAHMMRFFKQAKFTVSVTAALMLAAITTLGFVWLMTHAAVS